jgi:hypothetical protein
MRREKILSCLKGRFQETYIDDPGDGSSAETHDGPGSAGTCAPRVNASRQELDRGFLGPSGVSDKTTGIATVSMSWSRRKIALPT